MPPFQRIHLVRHGETVGAETGYAGDPALTRIGEQQSALTADHLTTLGVSSVYVSPLLRARQTAAPMASLLGTTPMTLPEMAEISLGDYPGDQIVGRERPKIDFEAWGGDSGHDFNMRVISGFQMMIESIRRETHQSIALITHGGTINVILDYVAGIQFDGEMRHLLANCSVSTLEIGASSGSLTTVNVVTHLPSELITPPGEQSLSTPLSR